MFETAIQIRLVRTSFYGPRLVQNGRTLWKIEDKDDVIISCLLPKQTKLVRLEPKYEPWWSKIGRKNAH